LISAVLLRLLKPVFFVFQADRLQLEHRQESFAARFPFWRDFSAKTGVVLHLLEPSPFLVHAHCQQLVVGELRSAQRSRFLFRLVPWLELAHRLGRLRHQGCGGAKGEGDAA
jgi:hypothetical protein